MSLLENAIGWLAPPVCVACGTEGSALCEACSTSDILPYGERCWRCGAMSLRARTCAHCRVAGSPRFVWITTDYEASAQKLVQLYKFTHQRAAVAQIAELMIETLLSYNADNLLKKNNYLVVPVPTATSRIRERSFDHTALLAKVIARSLQVEFSPAVGRLGQTRQVGAHRQERLNQPLGKYFVRNAQAVSGRNILLIDDVVTTGGTLQTNSLALRQADASHVDALVFAKRL